MTTRFSTEITVDGKRVEISVPKGSKATGYANSVFCPLGPAPTQAWLVILKSVMDELDLNSPHTIVWRQALTNLDDGSSQSPTVLTFSGMYLIKSERLLCGGVGDTNALFLVEFADSRLLAANKSDSDVTFSNLRSYANSSNYLTGTDSYDTWDKLLQRLWDKCSFLGTYPNLPGTLPIDGKPEQHWFVGHNAYKCLNTVLDHLDCALCHDPTTNQYTIVQLGATQTVLDSNSDLKWSGEPYTLNVSQTAATLAYYFARTRRGYGQERDTELYNNWVLNDNHYRRTETTGITGAQGVIPYWDDLAYMVGEDGTIENQTAINTRTTNRKNRYVTRYAVTTKHRIHIGLKTDFIPGGQIRAVIWRNFDDYENQLGGTCTEYICKNDLIYGYKPATNGNVQFWMDEELGTPEHEQYSPLDLSRHTYPSYPRLPNIVQVNHDGETAGAVVSANTDGFHKGVVKRWVDKAMVSLDPCWILFVDDYDNNHGNVTAIQLDYYGPARLSGVATSSGLQYPLYLVRKSASGTGLTPFRLTSALSLGPGNVATAQTMILSGGSYTVGAGSQTITVVDSYSTNYGMWSGPVGAQGLASQRSDGKYDIVYMQRRALIVEFTVSTDRAGGSDNFAATVANSFDQGDTAPVDSGTDITIWDADRLYPGVVDGSRGKAIWNDKANRYECLVVTQRALYGTAVIQMSSGMDSNGIADITGFVVTSPAPFNVAPTPLPVTCRNSYGHKGKDGDTVELLWHQTLGAYIVIDVEKKAEAVLMDIRINVAKTFIEVRQATCAVEYATNPTFVTKIPLKECP